MPALENSAAEAKIDVPPTFVRLATLTEREPDLTDAARVFAGPTLEVEDRRRDHGESRVICFGYLAGRMVVVGNVPRGSARHVFSMRKANAREKARVAPLLEV